MQTFLSVLRPSVRSLLARPAYFVVSVVILGVSIAAQLAIFAVVAALLLTPPSARQPDELVFVESSLPGGKVSYPDFRDIQERMTSFTGTFGYYLSGRAALTVSDDLIPARCAVVSGSYFPTLSSVTGEGRMLETKDDVENAPPVVVISRELSRQRNLAVGAAIKINTFPFTVVGVLPEGYRGIERLRGVDVWIPAAQLVAVSPRWVLTNRGSQSLTVGGRLKPGVSLASANAELAAVARAIQAENAKVNYGMTLQVRSFTGFRYALDGSARVMVLLCGLVWFLFALAFTNFFALTLLRLLARRRELAMKVAMGATRAHLGCALLVELGCVVASSFAVGGGLAWALLQILQRDPRLQTLIATAGIRLDLPALGIIGGLVAGSALVVWWLAIRSAGRVDVISAIKDGSSAPRRQTAFATLLAVQFAIALFLGATAASFVGSLQTLATQTYPFRTENLLLFDVNFRNLGFGNERAAIAEKFLVRLRAVPGAVTAAGSTSAPLGGIGWTNVIVDGRDPALEPDKGFTNMMSVTGDYFPTAGIRLQRGRSIAPADTVGPMKVVMINATAAKRYWPGRDPVGETLKPWEGGALLTIVGVTDDVPTDTSGKILPQIYLPWGQAGGTFLVFHVAVERDSAAVRRAIADSLRDVWPPKSLPVLRSVREQMGEASADLQVAVRIIFLIAGFATLVTSCGLYFFSAYTAVQTLKDSAIRQALGAQKRHLLVAHLARYCAGLGAGLALGLGMLFGAPPVFGRLGIAFTPVTADSIAVAVTLLSMVAVTGLCAPVIRVLGKDLARILSQST